MLMTLKYLYPSLAIGCQHWFGSEHLSRLRTRQLQTRDGNQVRGAGTCTLEVGGHRLIEISLPHLCAQLGRWDVPGTMLPTDRL